MNKKIVGIILIIIGIIVALFILFGQNKAGATIQITPYSKTICHHTPGNQITKTFNTLQGYLGHLATPHSGQTYDTNGACVDPTPTPTPVDYCDTVEGTQPEDYDCPKEEEPTPTPTPTPTDTPCRENCGNPPTFAGSSTNAPVCSDGLTVKLAANVHVVRNGDRATVNFFITEGDRAHVYWSVVGQPHWGNSSANEYPAGLKPNGDNFVTYEVKDLNPNLGYDFGVQQVRGCGGGLVTSVVVDDPTPTLFPFTYWEWSK